MGGFAHAGDIFSFDGQKRQKAGQLRSQAEALVGNGADAAQIAEAIERLGTPVYLLEGGFLTRLLVNTLRVDEGFIAPDPDNHRYMYLCRMLEKRFSRPEGIDTTNGFFVVTRDTFTPEFLSHQLHHWLACVDGQPGYAPQAQKLYKAFWEKHGGDATAMAATLPLGELEALRAAIQREIEAMAFLRKLATEKFNPRSRRRRLNGVTGMFG